MQSLPLAPVAPLPDLLELPSIARGQDGVFTRSQARADGWGDRAQRRMISRGLWIPAAGTVLRHRDVPDGPWQRARAVHLTCGLAASHATAGGLWQLLVPSELHGIGHVLRRPKHVVTHRLALQPGDTLRVRGLHVTSVGRTLTDLICSLGEDAAVEMLTDAFRRGLLGAGDVRTAARRAHGRHGVALARHLADSCRHEPHSPLEWRFHSLVRALGPGWQFNVDIHDEQGFVGRVDALHGPTGTVVELDGRTFHGRDQFQSDRTRDQRLVALGLVVVRLTWADVTDRPMEVVERLRRVMAIRQRDVRSAGAGEAGGGWAAGSDPDASP